MNYKGKGAGFDPPYQISTPSSRIVDVYIAIFARFAMFGFASRSVHDVHFVYGSYVPSAPV